MPVTLRFQSTGTVPGRGDPIRMNGKSLTIGRGDENDFVLPDPEKLISKRHCAIEDHGGNIVIIDLSTNGTFLNYGKVPLGRVPTPLSDGDILSLGTYELLVDIPAARGTSDIMADLPPPLEDGPVSPGQAANAGSQMDLLDDPSSESDFLDDLLGASDTPAGPSKVQRPQLGDDCLLPPLGEDEDGLLGPASDPNDTSARPLSAHNPSVEDHFQPRSATPMPIPDDWDDEFLKDISPPQSGSDEPSGDMAGSADDAPATGEVPSESAKLSPERVSFDLGTGASGPSSAGAEERAGVAPANVERTSTGPDVAARAFLKSAGAEGLGVSDAELVPTLSRMGHVLRIMIQGLREILMTRTSIKSEFRINQTMIGAGGNNPLKFSISPEQAVEAMIKPTTKGYLDATEAAEQALRDIKAHEVAMMAGMEAALKGVLHKLSPDELAGRIETSSGFGSILKGKKARYWEVYEKMYAEISDQAENDFHELFSKEFVRAYQKQLERLK